MTKLVTTIENHTFEVEVDWLDSHMEELTVRVNGQPVRVRVPDWEVPLEEVEWMVVSERPYEIVFDPDLHWIRAYCGIHHIDVRDQEAAVARPQSKDGRVKAPIPGLITRLLVQVGETVESGQPLMVLEAMKMENEIRATQNGNVKTIHVTLGQSVIRNEVLAEIG